tara:strand:- start:78 stop:518 length:441 start_codon:yes stop_codon:yes gene_type:complete
MDVLRILNAAFFPIYYITAKRFLVIGHCMEPELREGESVFINKIYYKLNKIQRNDIIGIKNNHKVEIKRIVGMPNDIISISGNLIQVNGKKIKENPKEQAHNNVQKLEVKLGKEEYYVLGDDYCPKCIDSRKYGPITKKQIIGKVL